MIYTSEKSFRNIWHEYRIYQDHIELDTFFKTIVINKTDIEDISIFSPPVIRTSLFALKIDLADFYTHIGIKRRNNRFKEIRFTPTSPESFLEAAKLIL